LNYFDYLSVARQAGISESELIAIEQLTRADYGSDDMLFELRMLRTCNAILGGKVSARQVIDDARRGDAFAA
jgi:hypothetical protein